MFTDQEKMEIYLPITKQPLAALQTTLGAAGLPFHQRGAQAVSTYP